MRVHNAKTRRGLLQHVPASFRARTQESGGRSRECGARTPARCNTRSTSTTISPECIVLERYRDSEALIQHLANLGDIAEAILATGSVSGELLGEPSAELRANLADSPVRLFTPYLSM
jgi:hypothetical protein